MEALEVAQELHPHDNTQALIDRLVITGLSALLHGHWEAPRLHGSNRDRWHLPQSLRRVVPENSR